MTEEIRTLNGIKKWGYSIGALGQVLPISFFNTFAFQYYVYTVGLDSVLTSIGIFLGLLVFAFSSPIFGVIVDNKKPGKLGKRRPLLLFCIPLLLIFMTVAWIPPIPPIDNSFYWPTAIYFWAVSIGIDLNQGLVVSTYLSMLAEQSTESKNRIQVASIQGLFMILGTIVALFIPMILQSNLEDPQNPLWNTTSGAYLRSSLPLVGLLFGVLGSICFILVFLSTDESFHKKHENIISKRLSVKEIFGKMMKPLGNRNYSNFMGVQFFFNMSLRILIVVLMPFLTFVLLLESNAFIWFILAVIPFAGCGYAIWNKMIHKTGLKKAYKLSMTTSVIVSFTVFIFFVNMPAALRLILGVILLGIAISSLVGGYLFPNPIVAQLIDEVPKESSNENSNENDDISGSYFGLYIFTYNIAQGIANLLMGFIFTGTNKENPAIIILSLPVSGILVLIAVLFLINTKIHDRISKKSE